MALCEIADEDMLGAPARANDADTRDFEEFGYYTDGDGKRKWGTIPRARQNIMQTMKESTTNGFRWIDMNGTARFDDNFDVIDAKDLESVEYET